MQRGQFNVAKVLRAAAHGQRVLAMEAALLSNDTPPPARLFQPCPNVMASVFAPGGHSQ